MTHTSLMNVSSWEIVLFVWGGEPQRHVLPTSGRIRIGREKASNDIAIADPSVSRHHAVVDVGPVLRLQDLGSINGTILRKGEIDVDCTATREDQHVSGQTFTVEAGDRISFGSVTSIVRKLQSATNSRACPGGTWASPAVVHDPTMQEIYRQIRNIAYASPRVCILILGDTGVGKDVLARNIHQCSSRANREFVAVDCAALSESLFERELFGHKRGAFTGAIHDSIGYFEKANGGTLFLDEIGELPLSMQAKLLRVLDSRQIHRVGDPQPRSVDVRVIAATNRRLVECIERGTFRRDLYYRLRGFELEIPSLATRRADIIPLAEAFLADACEEIGQVMVPKLSPDAISVLQGYSFPGNVRELRNAMAEALAHCRDGRITSQHLPAHILGLKQLRSRTTVQLDLVEGDPPEKVRIIRALEQCAGNQTRAAKMLSISLRTLHNKSHWRTQWSICCKFVMQWRKPIEQGLCIAI